MIRNLHLKMTIFCTLVTSFILAAMSLSCMLFFQSLLTRNDYAVYEKNRNTIVAYLENETVIDYEQLSKIADNRYYTVVLFERNNQLTWSESSLTDTQKELVDMACRKALTSYNFDVNNPPKSKAVTKYLDFTTTYKNTERLVSLASLPNDNGSLCLLTLYSRFQLKRQIWSLRLLFIFIDIIALILLFLFAWKFSAHILRPVEESREKQTQFVAAASHELRSPLSVILAAITALKVADEADKPGFYQSIETEGERMKRLIDDMLTLANADSQTWSMHFQNTQLDTLLLNVYDKYLPYARNQGCHLSIQLPEDPLPDCSCDCQRIEQIMGILLDNAIHYTPSQGIIQIGITMKNDAFQLWVSDNGPGIPDSDKEQVFERFFRGDSSRKDKQHYGLGLCVAKEIIRLHNGRIWVEDNTPSGCIFYVMLSAN